MVGILNLRVKTGWEFEVPAPLSPVFCVGNRLQYSPLRHMRHHLPFKINCSLWCTYCTKPTYDWPSMSSSLQVCPLAGAHGRIQKPSLPFKSTFDGTD